MIKWVLCFALIVIFGTASSLDADVIRLKNGDVMSGKTIALQNGVCTFATPYGSANMIPVGAIKSITTDASYDIKFLNGETARGRLDKGKNTQTVIKSENFGDIVISPSAIVSMVRVFDDKQPELATNTSSSHELENSLSTEQAEDQEYGNRPEEEPPLDFLTGSTVLLAPGTYEVEFDLNYKNSRTEYALPQEGYFQRSAYSIRALELGMSLRGGLAKKLEGWVRVPFSYTRVEDVSSNTYVRDQEDRSIGDVSFGFQYLIVNESATLPAISISLSATAPTGEKRYRRYEDRWLDALDNGGGHWSVSPGISFVRTTDPAIIYGGLGYKYTFRENIDGYTVEPGWGMSGYFGVGFALNEKLSVGGQVSYGYFSEMKADGEEIKGSSYEPMDISFLVSYRFAPNWVVSPQVTYGLNDDSGAPMLGLRLTRRFN